MQKTAILSTETLRSMIEAQASMAAWYYELWRVLREGGQVQSPDEAKRLSYLKSLAREFPEIASIAATIEQPRLYVPQPVIDLPAPAVVPAGGSSDV